MHNSLFSIYILKISAVNISALASRFGNRYVLHPDDLAITDTLIH